MPSQKLPFPHHTEPSPGVSVSTSLRERISPLSLVSHLRKNGIYWGSHTDVPWQHVLTTSALCCGERVGMGVTTA